MLLNTLDIKELFKLLQKVCNVNSSTSPVPPPDLTDPNIRVQYMPLPALPGDSPRHPFPAPFLETQTQLTDETRDLFGEDAPITPDENLPLPEEEQDQNNVSENFGDTQDAVSNAPEDVDNTTENDNFGDAENTSAVDNVSMTEQHEEGEPASDTDTYQRVSETDHQEAFEGVETQQADIIADAIDSEEDRESTVPEETMLKVENETVNPPE